MKRSLSPRWLLLLITGLGGAAASAQPVTDAEARLPDGIAALQEQRWDEARSILGEVVSAGPGTAAAAQGEFYLGLLYQSLAAQASDPAARRPHLEAAVLHYEGALQGLPRSGPTLNNLARVLGELGEFGRADAIIGRALALDDGKQASYLRTRADLADWRPASPADRLASWQAAFEAAPDDEEARQKFVALALSARPAAVGETAQRLLDRGAVQSAEALLTEVLPQHPAPRESLMLQLADVLAAGHYDPRSFNRTARVLQRLATESDVGAAAQELLDLHVKPSPRRDAYPWWTRDYQDYAPSIPKGRSARFRRLVLALGDSYRLQGGETGLRRAQPYAELALELSGNTADPRAVLLLADVYANTGQRDRLRDVSNKYVQKLFQGKGEAYASGNQRQIYEHHLALGSIFAYLEQWENPQWAPASAIFQLEHARTAAASFNRSVTSASGEQLVVPPNAIAMLSSGYLATNRPEQSVNVCIESARVYEAQGRPMLRDAVLQSPAAAVAVARTAPATQATWNAALRDSRVTPVERPPAVVQPPAAVQPRAVVQRPAVMQSLEVGTDRPGSDLQPGFQLSSAEDCSARCAALQDCRAMTFVKHAAAEGGICWLKGSVPAPVPAAGITSAIKQ
jgi:tetratricopeptide (TPR) repeat protein